MSVPGSLKNRPLLWQTKQPEAMGRLLAGGALHAETWACGDCTVFVAREPFSGEYRWHMSISHPNRYPTWDEIKIAAYEIPALKGTMLAQVLSPGDGTPWVNVHENCFHLWEIHDEKLRLAQ